MSVRVRVRSSVGVRVRSSVGVGVRSSVRSRVGVRLRVGVGVGVGLRVGVRLRVSVRLRVGLRLRGLNSRFSPLSAARFSRGARQRQGRFASLAPLRGAFGILDTASAPRG